MSKLTQKKRLMPNQVLCGILTGIMLAALTVAAAHGQTVKQLTTAVGDDDEPCFSPDGKWIVYQSRDAKGRVDLWVAGSNGGQPQRITSGAGYKCFPTWSPDGKRIVFASDPVRDWVPDTSKVSMGAYDLYAIDSEKGSWSGPKQLTNTPKVMEYLPSYSPDGRHIAYSCGLPTGYRLGDMAIFIMSAEGEQARAQQGDEGMEGGVKSFEVYGRQLVSSEHGAIEPTWSRDGKTIAFAYSYYYQNVYGHQLSIALIPACAEKTCGKNASRLKQLEGFPNYSPAFSPRADLLAFVASKGQAWDIWVLAGPYTGEPVRLTDHPANDVNPAWSPDGKRIAFASNRDGNYNIYIMEVPKEVLAAGGQR